MLLTKYEHACFTLEKDGKLLIIDPGGWTTDIGALENVVAIVVTHEHADHFDPAALGGLIAHNPNATIYAHEAITRQLDDTVPHQAVRAGEVITIESFTLEFFGGEHALIHNSLTPVANLAVMINNHVYYPGDSFTAPHKPVTVLALPVSAPWLKISEVIDFANTLKASFVFPTHDAILSTNGKALVDRMLPPFVQKHGGTYQRISEPTTLPE